MVLEKGRGVGGRASTRRIDRGPSDSASVDLGAQYFRARERAFQEQVERWSERGAASWWRARFARETTHGIEAHEPGEPRWLGTPTMSALCKVLSEGVRVRCETQVTRITRVPQGPTRIETSTGHVECDVVLVTAPAPQTAALLEPVAPDLASEARRASMAPCWAAVARVAEADVGFDALDGAEGSAVAWLVREASKPQRTLADAWVVHASSEWSEAHLERSPDEVAELLAREASARLGGVVTEPVLAHRWRFARVLTPLGRAAVFDPVRKVGMGGDWCLGPRIEAAFASGQALAAEVLALVRPREGAA